MLYTDGFKNKNGSGFTLCDENGKLLLRKEISGLTNNAAELHGIACAAAYGKPGEDIITDSKVCQAWIKRGSAKARPDLYSVVWAINRLMREKNLTLRWLPREQNLAGVYNEALLE